MQRIVGLAALALITAACVAKPGQVSRIDAPPANRFADVELAKPDMTLPAYADPALDPLRRTTLTRFSGEAEFMAWVKRVADAAEARGDRWWRRPSKMANGVAMTSPPSSAAPSSPSPPPPPPASAPVGEASPDRSRESAVTGSDSPENPEITNNQKAGVDEGGIIKQIGNFLVVLQDGRLFIADLMPGGKPGLALANRANVYRSANEDTWYDEMLVSGRTIVVTGYSYIEDASEFTVLTLADDGKVTREATFYISSDDYYSGSNYATRMIDGKLVIHTPIYLAGRGWWDRFDPPVIREWRREGGDGGRDINRRGRPMFKAEDIWMPVQRLLKPVIHMVTVCDIAGATDAKAPACEATAMVGSADHQFLVTSEAFWLWMSPDWSERQATGGNDGRASCETGHALPDELAPSVLVRLPISGETPSVLNVRGRPQDQFSMDMDAGTFRAVLDWYADVCGSTHPKGHAQLTYFDTPLSALSGTLAPEVQGRYVRLPSPGGPDYEARFTEAYLVYGKREGWSSRAPTPDEAPRAEGQAVIVPVLRPDQAISVRLPHDVIRAERAGPYMALTGYRDFRGLSVSLIDLRAGPRVSSTFVLENRYESENRSHAFNSRIGADGIGLIGLPTVPRPDESNRWWWWSASSDLTYLATDREGGLSAAGQLDATRRDPGSPSPTDYVCEVSCVDWYGNSRPIFTGKRILALMNSELVEGAFENGRVTEIRRLDLTAKPQ